jgi:hypothetical protein
MTISMTQKVPAAQTDSVKPVPISFLATTKKLVESTDNAYDVMNLIKKLSSALGLMYYKKGAEGYVDAVAVPRLPSVAISLAQRIGLARTEKMTLRAATDISHKFFDFGSTACYAGAFFNQNHQLPLLKVGSVFDVCSDATDLANYAFRYQEIAAKQERAKTAAPTVLKTIHLEKTNAVLHIVRAIAAVAASVFAAYLFFTGISLFPAMIAVTASIASSALSILTYYHEHYWCNDFRPIV